MSLLLAGVNVCSSDNFLTWIVEDQVPEDVAARSRLKYALTWFVGSENTLAHVCGDRNKPLLDK